MIRLAQALFGGWHVVTGRVERICAPGKWRVWRDDAGLHLEVMARTKVDRMKGL